MPKHFFDKLRLKDAVIQLGGVKVIDRVIGYDQDLNLDDYLDSQKRDTYFLAGIREGVTGRASDKDIIKKNYIGFDFDIRENEKKAGRECSDEKLEQIVSNILNELDKKDRFKNYSHVLLSGNGAHVYFFGKPVDITGTDIFRAGMSALVEEIGSFTMKPDPACVNVGRIMRLPGSLNTKNGFRTKLIVQRNIESMLVSELVQIGQNELENQAKIEMGRSTQLEPVKPKNSVYDAINDIPIQDLVCKLMKWEFDGDRHFTEPGSTKKKASFIGRDGNYIVHGGTDHFSNSQIGYSPFHFAKMVLNLSSHETFEWFKKEYKHIKEADIIHKKDISSSINKDDLIKISNNNNKKNDDDKIIFEFSELPEDTFFTDLLAYVDGTTDAPREFVITAGLSAAATVLKNKVWFVFGRQRIRPHLYTVILGASSLLRKTTSINIARDLINEAEKIINDKFYFSNEITPESFIELLEERPYGLFTFSEIRGFLVRMEKTYMGGFKEMLTDLYDCPSQYTKTRKNKKGDPKTFYITSPTINILAGSTMDWFLSGINNEDLSSGFLPRFIFAFKEELPEKTIIFPEPDDEEKKYRLAKNLAVLSSNWHSEKYFSDGAKEVYTKWATEIDKKMRSQQDPILDAFYARLGVTVIKIAIIVEGLLRVRKYMKSGSETFDNSNFISREGMIVAAQIANYYRKVSERLVKKELAFTTHDKIRLKIIKIIKRSGSKMRKRELLRAIGGSVNFLNKILEGMEEAGYIEVDDQRTSSGQNTTVIKIIK